MVMSNRFSRGSRPKVKMVRKAANTVATDMVPIPSIVPTPSNVTSPRRSKNEALRQQTTP
jgi:hypothetical protein